MSQVYKTNLNFTEPTQVSLTTTNGEFQLTIERQEGSIVTIQIGAAEKQKILVPMTVYIIPSDTTVVIENHGVYSFRTERGKDVGLIMDSKTIIELNEEKEKQIAIGVPIFFLLVTVLTAVSIALYYKYKKQ